MEITLQIRINAPIERCFDLARSIDFHVHSTAATREQAVSGVTGGLIGKDQEVEWRARHFGLWFKMRVHVTAFSPPAYFQDIMVEGPFRSFAHDHNFEAESSCTLMTDHIIFASPIAFAGHVFDKFILGPHLRSFVQNRNIQLKAALESNTWQRYLQDQR